MAEDKDESVDTRRFQIIEFIKAHPGTHLREIKRELGISMGVVQYHLYTLEKEKRIISRRRGMYKRFYINLVFGEKDQEILDALSQEAERDIILFLIQKPNATNKQISDYLRVLPGATTWHMKRLVGSGLVNARRDESSSVRYSVSGDSADVLRLVKSYHTKIWERWADRLAETLTGVSVVEEVRKGDSERN